MSWGKGIAVALILFVGMIGTMVYLSVNQHFSLVTDRYYEESLEYDEVQTKASNYSRLGAEVTIEVDNASSLVSITLPEGFREKGTAGKVHFYNPVDSRYDRHFDLEQPFRTGTGDMRKGKWKVIVDWEKDGRGYLFERVIFIN
jgi:nitrogen fixation protein FixH